MTAVPKDTQPDSQLAGARTFPPAPGAGDTTVLVLQYLADRLPVVAAVTVASDVHTQLDAAGIVAAAGETGTPLLPEHWTGLFTRPGLRGYRLGPLSASAAGTSADDRIPATGRDWSPKFEIAEVSQSDLRLEITAADTVADLELATEIESLVGGSLRIRHTVTNLGSSPYVVDGLDVVVPCPDHHDEVLDFSGRHERERTPQRHEITDGLWLREGRQGRSSFDTGNMLVTGRQGFGFADDEVQAVHVGWSGNVLLRLERSASRGTTIGGGELLLPGEIALTQGESYQTPWVYVAASSAGLDGLAASFHTWLRSLPSHPAVVPVTLNVWEAVYFDHDRERLASLAARAARIGVERFVLDDGWFHLRRSDSAGLGDWWIDPAVWPDGLTPLIEQVNDLGMEFGLWFEPEMVNPDSDLYRAHPDWVLAAGDRNPLLERNQLALDLSRPEVVDYLFDAMHAVLSEHRISYVKWDHNRELLEAGTGRRSGAPAVHENTLGYYRLLDRLRKAHPDITWESCASGGGRIDLEVLERVQRVWTSDMTEALSRQSIQRWMTQLVAPEYLGAHVSAPTSHQTGRTLPLDFRCATALFGAFGIEWDITRATDAELDTLAEWIARFKRFRTLIGSGRLVRGDSPEPAVMYYGMVAPDGSEALMAHVQLDESLHGRGVQIRVPGLDPDRRYLPRWEGYINQEVVSHASPVLPVGPTSGQPVSGRVLATQGFWVPRRRPETILLTHITAVE